MPKQRAGLQRRLHGCASCLPTAAAAAAAALLLLTSMVVCLHLLQLYHRCLRCAAAVQDPATGQPLSNEQLAPQVA